MKWIKASEQKPPIDTLIIATGKHLGTLTWWQEMGTVEHSHRRELVFNYKGCGCDPFSADEIEYWMLAPKDPLD